LRPKAPSATAYLYALPLYDARTNSASAPSSLPDVLHCSCRAFSCGAAPNPHDRRCASRFSRIGRSSSRDERRLRLRACGVLLRAPS
jgi:hypothetical protein